MSDELVAPLSGSFESVRETVVGALIEQGYGVPTSVDVGETLREKLGAEVEAYEILGACNPSLAYRALEIDRRVGLLLPCPVTLRETDVGVEVRAGSAGGLQAGAGAGAGRAGAGGVRGARSSRGGDSGSVRRQAARRRRNGERRVARA